MKRKYRVTVEGKVYLVEVEGIEDLSSGVRETPYLGEERGISVKEKEPYGKFETISSREKTVISPMPAKVIKVNCKAGEKVKAGELLLVIEAMKMENEILSPIDGEILEVRVREGESVSQGDTLIVFK